MTRPAVKLRPNYLRATIAVFLSVAAILAVWAVIDHVRNVPTSLSSFLGNLLPIGTVMTLAISFMSVPRELEYDADWFEYRLPFRRPCCYAWKNLEAFGWGEGVFLLKFRDRDTLQISGCAFRRRAWRAFLRMVRTTFPEKKCYLWIDGLTPASRRSDEE